MVEQSVRWKLKFTNFLKANEVFERRLQGYQSNQSSEAERMALIQSFEVIIEVVWKLLKHYLRHKQFADVAISSPNSVIRTAMEQGTIDQTSCRILLVALKKRNQTSHVYHQEVMSEVLAFVSNDFSAVILKVKAALQQEYDISI
jgi:nucleotidyltransferase substrate binding protein (TIGR01987 family)